MAHQAGKNHAASLANKISSAKSYQKYTVHPEGFWGRVHAFFALDPKRSSGVPMNAQFRNPPPGGNDPLLYDDPVTVPAADLAENPYWKRDIRRSYPKLSVVNQSDVVGLLTVGSAAQPKDDVLKLGEAGSKQLAEVKEAGSRGLSTYFQSQKDKGLSAWKAVAGPDGLPPTPSSMHLQGKAYKLTEPEEQTYGGNYPCRTFV
ncbi:NADH-ubiquinone oxidoreductase [Fulvia fulva]|uniref:NADH-ubiquinone oxidoreductase n=1 Tax=Passalora fulva TaxID=5499 RepID=A0A9Q8PL96_PASFU|nr:NADH-ubiquinone oxidoreductase [Fulvia fulva]KAK4610603.1 NADH-ubiquinone oxidoreductase [Fulvia fulva]KAK4611364.1 NADH-ubiquinone oxidoreductase [Fulvia fulva]UJO24543.1 NADH-ubiquinone oxidoreductase [Fulvia fulva]WPV22047.1 NADH-ubiquinone oxidoreductase [Fulvia fulva]WPV37039.1 NADH-ubiquinone oxidoreductase [Fulvia fulva]